MKTKYNLTYEESDIIDEEVKYKLKEDNPDNKTEEEIKEQVYTGDCLSFAWDDFKECLNQELESINKSNSIFKIKGKNMGWRHLEGSKILKASNSTELLNGILPKTNEFSLYIKTSKTQILIKCSHHDAPTGEYYYIKPLNKKELKQYEKENY